LFISTILSHSGDPATDCVENLTKVERCIEEGEIIRNPGEATSDEQSSQEGNNEEINDETTM
jgi:hypothetical protein